MIAEQTGGALVGAASKSIERVSARITWRAPRVSIQLISSLRFLLPHEFYFV